MWVFPKIGVPKSSISIWFSMKYKSFIFWVFPLFLETPIYQGITKKKHHDASHPSEPTPGFTAQKNSPISISRLFFFGGGISTFDPSKIHQMSGKTTPNHPWKTKKKRLQGVPWEVLVFLSIPRRLGSWRQGMKGCHTNPGDDELGVGFFLGTALRRWMKGMQLENLMFFFWGGRVVGVGWLDDFCVFFFWIRDNFAHQKKNITWFQPEPWDFETKHPSIFWGGKQKTGQRCVLLFLGGRYRPNSNHHEARDAKTSSHEALDKKWRFAMKLTWKLMAKFLGSQQKWPTSLHFGPTVWDFSPSPGKLSVWMFQLVDFWPLKIPATCLGGCPL